MKESDGEGLAICTGPESCGVSRKGGVEALTGVRMGWVLSRERFFFRFGMPTLCINAEGNTGCTVIARCTRILRGLRPQGTYGNTSHENREIPCPLRAEVAVRRKREV